MAERYIRVETDVTQQVDTRAQKAGVTYAGFRECQKVFRSVATFARRYPVGAVAALVLVVIGILAVVAPIVLSLIHI